LFKLLQKMRKFLIPVLSIFLFSFTSASKFSYSVECSDVNSDGTITLKIWNAKKGKEYKAHQASINAVHCILYSGISSNGCGNQNPLLNNDETIAKFEKANPDFFQKSGDYGKYISTSSVATAIPSTIRDKSWKVYEVVVNKKQLEKYLANKQIKKTLNNGF